MAPSLPQRASTATIAALLATAPFLLPAAGGQSGTASVTFDGGTSGGTTVEVAEVQLPGGGFLALHDASLAEGEVLGSVVGASGYLSEGSHEDVRVHLSEPLTDDSRLTAMPHHDTDGDHVYAFVAGNGEVDGPYTADGEAVTDAANVTVSAAVTADDQPTDGDTLVVDRVEVAEGGFVAIHDDRLFEDEPVASVIGHSAFLSPGVHEHVRVNLTAPLAQDETIVAMPHRDSDGDGEYDFADSRASEDPPYRNADDEAVVDRAQARVADEAEASFADQSSGGHAVHVSEAFLPEGGFVTMHDSSLAEDETFASVRGTSACLDPGLHHDVLVELDDPTSEDDTLFAMPHRDTDDDCTYDFVDTEGEDDGPYTSGGDPVTDDGSVTVSASVDYANQSSDGRTIVVDHVDLAEPGFVAVHTPALLAGQVTDSVVGASELLDAGAHEDVEIVLDDPIRTSQALIPMPHRDTDGDGTYGFVESDGADDGPFVDGDGEPVVDTGYTVVRAQVTFEDQEATDNVTVANVTMHDGGFVTIHDESLLEGEALGSVVGVTERLDPGTHREVYVGLQDRRDGETTLIAMPHRDTNGNDAYDFVESRGEEDGPYTAAGGAVIHDATVTFVEEDRSGDRGAGDGDDRAGETGDVAPGEDADATEDAPSPTLGALLVALLAATLLAADRRR